MSDKNEIVLYPEDTSEITDLPLQVITPGTTLDVVPTNYNDIKKYGKQITRSHLCAICTSPHHDRINLLRSRDHLTLDEIVDQVRAPGVTLQNLDKHFRNHFHISKQHNDIISLKESNVPENLEIVSKVLEGELDIFAASQSILDVKAKRLHMIMARIEFINALNEDDSADDVDKQEFFALNKLATDLENSMEKIYQIMDKKLFPSTKDELSNAVLQYKLNVLSKIIDGVQLVLLELEKDPKYFVVIQEIRSILASRIGNLEDEILKSGGIIK